MDASKRIALNQIRLNYERNMMSWIGTATSLITFGFGIYKLFQLELGRGQQDHRIIGTREFSVIMVGIGLLALVLGSFEHLQNMRALKAEYPAMPWSRAGVIAALLSVLGLMAFLSMIFRQ